MTGSISALKENVQNAGVKDHSADGNDTQIPRKASSRFGLTGLWLVALGWLIPFTAFANPSPQTPELQKVQAEKYEIEVRFEPEKGFLHARAAVTLRVPQKTETIEMELSPRLNILEVTDSQGRKLEFRRSGLLGSPKLQVWLGEAAAAEQEITLTFVYEGAMPRGTLDYITQGGILLRDESRWYPAVDLSAFTRNKVTIGVPSRWYALTGGSLSSSIGLGLAATYNWETTRPIASRSIAAVPGSAPPNCVPTPIQERGFSRIQPLSACFVGPKQESINRLLKIAHDLLQRYSLVLGPYPHGTLTVVPGFTETRGAIGYSAPGFMVVSEDVIKHHGYPGWAPEFLPHEIAHQWFPIEVTLQRQEDGWLAESLAEYLAWRYLLESDSEQARRMVQRAMRDALAPQPLPPLAQGLKLFREPWEVTHATLYQRGLLVWRTLETVIDRERVDLALREYYKRFAGKSASIANFRKICEEISGRDLGWFFEYFINGTQIPEISLRRLPSDAPNVLLGEIVVNNVPADFQVRVEMRVQTAKSVVEHSVATRGEVTPFSINLPAAASRVTLDPDMRLLRWTEAARINREQLKLLAQIGEAESMGEFLHAIELCRSAITLDTFNVAANQQQIHFVLGRLFYRAKKFADAQRELGSALEVASLDAMETDFYRAWAHVFRARIDRQRGQPAAAQKEDRAGLASNSPAMETKVMWPEDPGPAKSAREVLKALQSAKK